MKNILACTVLLTLSAVPAFGQVADSGGQPAASSTGAVDLSGFRDEIANKNKALADKVKAEQLLVKKNAAIIDDAKKIAADNNRLDAERKQLELQNAEFERQRQAMMSAIGDTSASSETSQPAPAPVRVEPQPTRVESQPARVEQQAAHMELAGANVIPAGSNMNQGSTQVSDPIVRNPPVGQISQSIQSSDSTQMASIPSAASATVVASVSSGPMRVPENVAMGLLLSPIRPVYPQIAQNARIQGEVVLDAVISKTGLIESLQAVSGPELLRRAAIDAVQKAHYQPYRVNGENVQVSTTVTVVFRMQS
jgi:periplasmic protein TonB